MPGQLEVIAPQKTSLERYRSRLNSGENTVSVGYRKRVNQPDTFELGGSSHNWNMKSKGAEGNFYNLRNFDNKRQQDLVSIRDKTSENQFEPILFDQGSHRRVNKNR